VFRARQGVGWPLVQVTSQTVTRSLSMMVGGFGAGGEAERKKKSSGFSTLLFYSRGFRRTLMLDGDAGNTN